MRRKRVLEDNTKIGERVVAPVLTELHGSWRMRDVARGIWGSIAAIGTHDGMASGIRRTKRFNTKAATTRRTYDGK